MDTFAGHALGRRMSKGDASKPNSLRFGAQPAVAARQRGAMGAEPQQGPRNRSAEEEKPLLFC